MKKKCAMVLMTGILLLSVTGCGASTNASADAAADMSARISTLETQLQEMEDEREIRNLVDQFSNLADEKKPAEQMELFTPDAEVIINMGENSNTMDYAQTEEAFARVLTNTDRLYHMNGQVSIEVNGDTATGVVYCRVVLIDENEDGILMETDEGVIYHDEYVKQDGKWLIARRSSDFIYQDIKPLSNGQ